jgi:hypothetical protein
MLKSENALVERDMLHMYPRQEVEIRARVLERVDHVVRHIRAGARLCVNPSAPQKDDHQCSPIWVGACWVLCTHLGHLCRQYATQPSIKLHSQSKDTYGVYVDRF